MFMLCLFILSGAILFGHCRGVMQGNGEHLVKGRNIWMQSTIKGIPENYSHFPE